MSIWIALGLLVAGAAVNAYSRFMRQPGLRFLLSLPAVVACLWAIWWIFDNHGWWQALLAFIGMGFVYGTFLAWGMRHWGMPASAIQEAQAKHGSQGSLFDDS